MVFGMNMYEAILTIINILFIINHGHVDIDCGDDIAID